MPYDDDPGKCRGEDDIRPAIVVPDERCWHQHHGAGHGGEPDPAGDEEDDEEHPHHRKRPPRLYREHGLH